MKKIKIKNFQIGKNEPLTVIAGPCVIESRKQVYSAAEELKKIFSDFSFNFIFKASYDKANRSSILSFRGPGIHEGLQHLLEIKEKLSIPILTDVHTPQEAQIASSICDMIQIPAFLCRQTDLIVACAKTGIPINIKKGQFLAPWDMKNIIEKATSFGNDQILLTDRGTCFGYNNLVSDMRSILIMQNLGYPVCFDATHSVQLPGGLGNASGGQREFIPILAKAAIASGANALFLEAHANPKEAKSDSSSQLSFKELPNLLKDVEKIYNAVNELVCD